ncbi:MAG: hypothetical protein WDM81_07020 [Rhizomicrobium sp.]
MALISIVFLGETVTTFNVAALIVLFIGILLISVDLGALRAFRLQAMPGFYEIAIATVLATIWTLGWNRFVSAKDGLSFAIWMYLAMTGRALSVRGSPTHPASLQQAARLEIPRSHRPVRGCRICRHQSRVRRDFAHEPHRAPLRWLLAPDLVSCTAVPAGAASWTQVVGGLVIVAAVMLLALA